LFYKGLAAFLLAEVATVNANSHLDLNSVEFNKYLNMEPINLESDPLKWWKVYQNEFPTLAIIAKKYLCVQGTSVPSERVFSCAGNIITDHRSSLSTEHAEELIFLSMNSKFVSK